MNTAYKDLKTKYGNEQTFYEKVPIGTVYTPDSISRQMIELSLESYVRMQSEWPNNFSNWALDEKIKLMLSLTIADLACGTGQLLLAYTEILFDLITQSNVYDVSALKAFVEKKMYGFDIEPEALDAGRQLFESFLGQDLAINLCCCDSLSDAMPLQAKSVDILLGNPPYIGEKGNTAVFEKIKKSCWGKPYYEGKMDYFYFFIYRGYDFVKPTGILCYLTSNYFYTADGAKKLRHFIRNTFYLNAVLDYSSEAIFNKRNVHACLFVLAHKKSDQVLLYDKTMREVCGIDSIDLFDFDENIRLIGHPIELSIIKKIKEHSVYSLSDWYDVAQGLVTGADRHLKEPVFVYTNEEADALPHEAKAYLKPLYKNSAIHHYFYEVETNYQVLYLTERILPDAVIKLLLPFKEHLLKRREVQNDVRAWYNLTWPRTEELFKGEKIVVPQRAKSNYFAYSNDDFYASADVYFIKATFFAPYSLKVLNLILNSEMYDLWLHHMGKKKGALLELYATPLKNIPLPNILEKQNQHLIAIANRIYDKPELQKELREEIETILMESFKLSESEKNHLKNIAKI